jgi:hypothetical protein
MIFIYRICVEWFIHTLHILTTMISISNQRRPQLGLCMHSKPIVHRRTAARKHFKEGDSVIVLLARQGPTTAVFQQYAGQRIIVRLLPKSPRLIVEAWKVIRRGTAAEPCSTV